MDELILIPRPQAETLTPLGELVQDFLQADVTALPLVTEDIPSHRLVDADLALAELDAEPTAVGVTGGQQRDHSSFPELLSNAFARFAPGPVDYISVATSPTTERRVVAVGVRLLTVDGHRVAVLQRNAHPEFGRNSARLEIVAAEDAGAVALLSALRRLMLERSVLRGQVISFSGNDYGPGAAGVDFLPRPQVSAADVVLPDGVLSDIVRHVVGIGLHRDALRAAGRHLKRGVLLYGPPGSGKTLTVRHLLSSTPDTTAVVLAGNSIRFVTEAAELARAMQPAIVVLEDVDLIAEDRNLSHGPQPLLFAMLDALDGLDGDADVAFVLTTNRVEVLEHALADRPGRIDLAVEIPLPDLTARHHLFELYARGLPLSAGAVAEAADAADGVSGAFAKELMRRTVLLAAEQARPVTDDDLRAAVAALLDSRNTLTHQLLGDAGQ
ncbi:AAA family ATPase [Cryobacterium sp. 1639]|uniref:AAA family ATPase n=1 Tax=Cryobacterium inferilacus TaxID=2866629 RepID=UPI001C72EFF8|nr:AAA family ATPase [Cryobacterium sp. 1639]MBX0300772.1 AAA family ATPase [Cryobacterium sp. 1639]